MVDNVFSRRRHAQERPQNPATISMQRQYRGAFFHFGHASWRLFPFRPRIAAPFSISGTHRGAFFHFGHASWRLFPFRARIVAPFSKSDTPRGPSFKIRHTSWRLFPFRPHIVAPFSKSDTPRGAFFHFNPTTWRHLSKQSHHRTPAKMRRMVRSNNDRLTSRNVRATVAPADGGRRREFPTLKWAICVSTNYRKMVLEADARTAG